jgi:hypothetical protein
MKYKIPEENIIEDIDPASEYEKGEDNESSN